MYAQAAAPAGHPSPSRSIPQNQERHRTIQRDQQMKPTLRQEARTQSPTAAALTSYLSTFFPENGNDVQYIYHRPFARDFNASNQRVSRVVLSVTPTKGFYDALRHNANLGFLHRPFGSDRKEVPKRATILACHKAFDEVLTVGWNLPLARRLGIDVASAQVVQGYKGDPERRIGIVGRFAEPIRQPSEAVKATVLREFGGSFEGDFGFEDSVDGKTTESSTLSGIAIMNAFHPAEVERVCSCANGLGIRPSELLYLTGAVREAGLDAARREGMGVICVGHRTCEEWGIRYLASRLRQQYPGLEVVEVLEEEEPPLPKQRKGVVQRQHHQQSTEL